MKTFASTVKERSSTVPIHNPAKTILDILQFIETCAHTKANITGEGSKEKITLTGPDYRLTASLSLWREASPYVEAVRSGIDYRLYKASRKGHRYLRQHGLRIKDGLISHFAEGQKKPPKKPQYPAFSWDYNIGQMFTGNTLDGDLSVQAFYLYTDDHGNFRMIGESGRRYIFKRKGVVLVPNQNIVLHATKQFQEQLEALVLKMKPRELVEWWASKRSVADSLLQEA